MALLAGLQAPALPNLGLQALTPALLSLAPSPCGPHLWSGAGGGAGAGAWLGSDDGLAGACLPHSPRPSPSPRPQGGPGSWPTLFKLPMSASRQLCCSEQSPGLFLRKGRGLSGTGPRPAPVPHTMGQEQGSWEAVTPRLHARQPRGWGAGRLGSAPRTRADKWEHRCPAVL